MFLLVLSNTRFGFKRQPILEALFRKIWTIKASISVLSAESKGECRFLFDTNLVSINDSFDLNGFRDLGAEMVLKCVGCSVRLQGEGDLDLPHPLEHALFCLQL